MKPWVKVFLVTVIIAVPAMVLGAVIWPPAEGGPEPTGDQLPFFNLLALIWWPHDNLHISNGNNLQGLLFIEYGFHFTLMIAALVLAHCFLSLIRQRSEVMEPPAARVR